MAHGSALLAQALVFRGRSRQNRAQIERTRFPVAAALPASRSRTPVFSRPDAPCDGLRRIDLATTAGGKAARLGCPTDLSPNEARFDQGVRARLTYRSAENPALPREQSSLRAPLSARPERSPHSYRRQCG